MLLTLTPRQERGYETTEDTGGGLQAPREEARLLTRRPQHGGPTPGRADHPAGLLFRPLPAPRVPKSLLCQASKSSSDLRQRGLFRLGPQLPPLPGPCPCLGETFSSCPLDLTPALWYTTAD